MANKRNRIEVTDDRSSVFANVQRNLSLKEPVSIAKLMRKFKRKLQIKFESHFDISIIFR